ncbi:MAG TPA: IS481 family transposase [Candidatus Dormibacteraeota bacterium]|nr:IS481 family transposase [Candidatus Dormibacteraeota bacterium]
MREMSVTEQRYKGVQGVLAEGRTVSEVAGQWSVSRRTMHRWLARYEGEGLEGLGDRSHRPVHCPHQMPAAVEVLVLEMRRAHPYWGARRIAFELARKGVESAPSESGVYRCLVRAAVIDPATRRRRRETWKRWERGGPMELWQLDVVHGFLLADGSSAKALTGIDDHSRFCVSARLMIRERTQAVCDGFSSALQAYGVPQQVLTDNGKVFTGRFAQPPVEVLFDRICRENGIDHILTMPRRPTTTGKIERFHRTLREDFNTRQVFRNVKTAQQALDEWVTYYNTQRPHQSLADATPESRFRSDAGQIRHQLRHPERNGEQWVSRRVALNGIVCVDSQHVSVGKHYGGGTCDVLVTDGLFQFWVGNQLLKTAARTGAGMIRKKHAEGTRPGSARFRRE